MKVGTDGVLLGSWAPLDESIKNILDIGTGTGLIALMLAQRSSEATIDAIEYDAPSAEEARGNFTNSPWSEKLNVINDTFQNFAGGINRNYGLVICNPPFFSKGIRNNCDRKANARHSDVLTQDDLISSVLNVLSEKGSFCLILPVTDYSGFKLKAARQGLFEHSRLSVKPTPQKPVKRVLSCWKKFSPSTHEENEMVLELSRHHYTEEFKKMTKEFYLK
ncbi:tRNA1(Val) (adenine(37)-N6)-methyltransferase [Marinilabilia rubra]|nr:methyltransferase [Marinilabilia rubra]